MHVLHVVGARPNFVKAAPVIRALACYRDICQTLVHTSQHYDTNMSAVFFRELEMPEPDVDLGVGSDSHARQTAEIMRRFEPVVLERRPDLVLVYGDVNSTVAAALVCSRLLIPLGHVEAGLRSFDRTMPEEINRLLTDQIADLLFTPSPEANENLLREGVAPEKIHFVGNVMIDTLVQLLPKSEQYNPSGLPERYALVTLHRPCNVDDSRMLESLLGSLAVISQDLCLILPVHPRTRQRIEDFDLHIPDSSRLRLVQPLSYLECLALQRRATVVITDSGGIQEESTWLGVPCLTVRENTERPVTVTLGTNLLVGRDMDRLQSEVRSVLDGRGKKALRAPALWDGRAANRIADAVIAWRH